MFSLYGAILTFCKCMYNHSINADMARNGNILQNSPDSWHHTANHVISYISGSAATWHHTANHVISYISGSVASWHHTANHVIPYISGSVTSWHHTANHVIPYYIRQCGQLVCAFSLSWLFSCNERVSTLSMCRLVSRDSLLCMCWFHE